MKLGISINCFEGTEFLENSIKEIRSEADFILLNYQKISYYGQPIDKEDLDKITNLQISKLIDQVICFDPNIFGNLPSTPYYAKKLERAKRENGRITLMQKGMTHFLEKDTDEFYKKDEFIRAKKLIEEKDIFFSACSIKEYVNKPIYQLSGFEDIYVPFIIKMGSHLKGLDYFVPCDPTRGYTTKGFSIYAFAPNEIMMHHFNNCRKNLFKKYQVTSRANLDRNHIPSLVKTIQLVNGNNTFKGRKIIIVPDYFKLSEVIK